MAIHNELRLLDKKWSAKNPAMRNRGVATEVLDDITRWLDVNRVKGSLIPFSPQGEVPTGVLRGMYEQHWFRPDPEFSWRMIRQPAQ